LGAASSFCVSTVWDRMDESVNRFDRTDQRVGV